MKLLTALAISAAAVAVPASVHAASPWKTCPDGSRIRTSQTCPKPAPAPTPSPTPSPTPAPTGVPAGYTVKLAAGLKCDGVTDDTAALQANLNGLTSYQALQLPAGTCATSNILTLIGKTNVMVFGAGKDATIIKASNPLLSAFTVTQDNGVILQGFQVYSPNATARASNGDTEGFHIFKMSGILLDSVKVVHVAGAGILLGGVNGGTVQNSEVDGSLADGFHTCCSSQNVTFQNNIANKVGDDAFAAIGYTGGTQLKNISFLNNQSYDGWWAGGIDFSGVSGGKAYNNKIYRSGIGCIEVANPAAFPTYGNENIDLQNNYCEGNVTRAATGHGVIMIYVGYSGGYARNITGSGNVIVNPASGAGVRAFGYSSTGNVQASLPNTSMTGVATPYSIEAYASVAH